MFPALLAAGRTLMGAFRGGSASKVLSGGPRGVNQFVESGAKGAGKSSPLDMLGNVANIAGVGMQGFELFKGGEKKPDAGPKPASHYESVLS